MSCTGCTSKFNVFRSEKSCPQCGFLFCSKCLCEKAFVPKSGSSKPVAVCRNCASVIHSSQQPKVAPSTSQVQLPNSDSGQNPPNTRTKANTTSKYDAQNERIRQRLDALRDDKTGPVVSQAQLEDRLAMLKDMDPEKSRAVAQVPFRITVDNRTQTEQTADLFAQYSEEVAIDSKRIRPEDEIAQRLAKLKGEEPLPISSKSSSSNAIDPQQFVASGKSLDDWSNKNLDDVNQLLQEYSSKFVKNAQKGLTDLQNDSEIQKYMKNIKQCKKNKLPQSHSDSDEDESQVNNELNRIAEVMKLEEMEDDTELSDTANRTSDNDELPYCCICNEDAVIRCIDCDRDLFCKRCFREGHDKEDEHRVVGYKVKKRVSD